LILRKFVGKEGSKRGASQKEEKSAEKILKKKRKRKRSWTLNIQRGVEGWHNEESP